MMTLGEGILAAFLLANVVATMVGIYFTRETTYKVDAVRKETDGMRSALEAAAKAEGKLEGKAEGEMEGHLQGKAEGKIEERREVAERKSVGT